MSNAAVDMNSQETNPSPFQSIETAPLDPILGLTELFLKDQNAKKVNLGVGVYQDNSGKVPVLDSVKEAGKRVIAKEITKSYLPIDGSKEYQKEVQKLLFGADSKTITQGNAITLQAVAGSGALKVGFDFIKRFLPQAELWQSAPSWENHRALAEGAGLTVKEYTYYNAKTQGIDLEGMKQSLKTMKAGTVVLLHVCCHNPTGVDIPRAAWTEIKDLIVEKNLIPFLDMAYQGFAESLEADAYPVRVFADAGVPCFVASSFSKNIGLYRERVGALTVITKNAEEGARVLSQLKRVVRTIYSSPPAHGALLATEILSTPELRAQWELELAAMRERMLVMRSRFVEELKKLGHDFNFVLQQHGMFSYSGLNESAVDILQKQYGIYMVRTGRICIAALNENNIEYVTQSISQTINS